jgi:hypothetical protein
MLVAVLIFDVALVGWSLHLMQEAVTQQEFSLMLAGTLVASAAAAMLVVYFLMGNCLSHLSQASYLSTIQGF